MEFTFGIITGGGADRLIKKCVESIRQEKIPKYEIIIVGESSAFGDDVRVIEFDESIKKAWITKKKNIVAQYAKYENIVFLHDYVSLTPGWYEGFLKFGNNFELCITKVLTVIGTRYRDYCLFKPLNSLEPPQTLLPYDFKPTAPFNRLMYVSGTYYIVKRSIALQYPLDERLGWGMAEDLVFCYALADAGIRISCNPNSAVELMKLKLDQHLIGNPIDIATLEEYMKNSDEVILSHVDSQKAYVEYILLNEFGVELSLGRAIKS